jgi:hypothetical protein
MFRKISAKLCKSSTYSVAFRIHRWTLNPLWDIIQPRANSFAHLCLRFPWKWKEAAQERTCMHTNFKMLLTIHLLPRIIIQLTPKKLFVFFIKPRVTLLFFRVTNSIMNQRNLGNALVPCFLWIYGRTFLQSVSRSLHSDFYTTCLMHATLPTHIILLDCINVIIFGEECKLCCFPLLHVKYK